MAIALAELPAQSATMQAIVLAVVAVGITVAVYGAVALIVKMDDIGLHLAGRESPGARAFGRGLVKAMPKLLKALSIIGTAAMIWVGGGIIVHGLEVFHLTPIPHWIHHVAEAASHGAPVAQGFVGWLVGAIGYGIVGLIVGGLLAAPLAGVIARIAPKRVLTYGVGAIVLLTAGYQALRLFKVI
jgi:predicted DNA repair protein MutK